MSSLRRGFTLLEVMIGLALLGVSLTVLIKSSSSSIRSARHAQLMGVSTELARGKMNDIEEKLLKDGFSDTDQGETDKTFEDEGWPTIRYSYKVQPVELPPFEKLQEMVKARAEADAKAAAEGKGKGSGSGSGSAFSDGPSSFENSALGALLAQLPGGGLGASDVEGAQGNQFIQGNYPLVQELLKLSIRKVTLVVTYDIFPSGSTDSVEDRCGWPNEPPKDKEPNPNIVCTTTVAYFTDSLAMDKILRGLGSKEEPEPGAGSGSGSGSGTGSGSSGPRPPGKGSGGK